jgi:hypothetical protein
VPRRSVRITLSNNTPFNLTLVDPSIASTDPCHGNWTDGGWRPPPVIAPKTHGQWQTESSGLGTGTEGWVKYVIENTDFDSRTVTRCPQELVYIHWDNPFVWNNTNPIDFTVSYSDVTPPCDADKGVWTFPSHGEGSSPNCRHELFGAGVSGGNQGGVTWWDAVANWPALLVFTVVGDMDENLEFIIGLRQVGSVDQTIFSFYEGSKGLRALANTAKISTLRRLFRM